MLSRQDRADRVCVAVADTLEVAISAARQVTTVGFVQLGGGNLLRVLSLVAVDNEIALVVVALADKPGEDTRRIGWVDDAALRRLSIPGRDIVSGDRPPKHVGCISGVGPALDTCEEAFNTGTEQLDAVRAAIEALL